MSHVDVVQPRLSLDLNEDLQLQLEARKPRVNKEPHLATGISLELLINLKKDPNGQI